MNLLERTRTKTTEATNSRREGVHREAALVGEGAGFRLVRRTGVAPQGALPLAEGIA